MSALAQLLRSALTTNPHPVQAIGQEPTPPAALLAQADEIAATLRAKGIATGESVLVTVRNVPTDIAAFLAVWEAGGIAVPIHAGAAPMTRAAVESGSQARLCVRDGRVEEIGAGAQVRCQSLVDAALIIFTSGSTGKPKGAVIGHERFAAKIEVLRRLVALKPQDHVVVPLQLIFIFGLWSSILALAAGARLTLIPRFSLEAVDAALDDSGTILAAVPSMLRSMLAAPRGDATKPRIILTGGEALGPALAEGLAKTYPDTGIFDLYGLTETGSCDFVLTPGEGECGRGTIGRPTEGVSFRVADERGGVSPGQTGELQILTPYGMLGYLNQPELTAASFVDGYFRTGDLVRTDPSGRVVLVGRAKEIVSRGGNKIAPLEIDNLLCSHPDVSAALCAGVPHDRLGEALYAVVIPRQGASVSSETLRDWLLERVERFKIPDVIEIVESLPTGATGKASRAALSERVMLRRG